MTHLKGMNVRRSLARTALALATALIAVMGAAASTASATLDEPLDAAASAHTIQVARPPGQTTSKVLDVANWSTADRGPVHLWAHRTTGNVNNQRWYLYLTGRLNGHPVYQIRNVNSGKCLDKSESVPNANGNAVYQYQCHEGNNQKWEVIPWGNQGGGMLRNLAGGRCLDVAEFDWSDGAKIWVWDCHGGWNQVWTVPAY